MALAPLFPVKLSLTELKNHLGVCTIRKIGGKSIDIVIILLAKIIAAQNEVALACHNCAGVFAATIGQKSSGIVDLMLLSVVI